MDCSIGSKWVRQLTREHERATDFGSNLAVNLPDSGSSLLPSSLNLPLPAINHLLRIALDSGLIICQLSLVVEDSVVN